jgi:PmbA protein
MDHKAFADQVLSGLKAAGADSAEIFIEEGVSLEVGIRRGEIETLSRSAPVGYGIRVFRGGRMAFVDSTDFTRGATDDVIEKAVALAQEAGEDPDHGLPSGPVLQPRRRIFDADLAAVSLEEKVERCRRAEEIALAYDRAITACDSSSYSDWSGRTTIANTRGVFASFEATSCSVGIEVVAERNGEKQPGGFGAGVRFYSDLPRAGMIAREAGYRAVAQLGGQPVESQKVPVVFDGPAGRRLLWGVASAVNGLSVYRGASFLGEKVGEHVASELVTIVDDGTMRKGTGTRPVDGEGVPTSRKVIIDRGVLKGYLYNTYAANKAGTKSTGNASRWGYGDLPGIGTTNLYMAKGTMPPDEIIRGVKNGFFVMGMLGFGVDAVTGSFSTGASGIWIRDGKLTDPVGRVTIASNMSDMLMGIDAIGDDLVFLGSTATPTYRIKEMTISGL